MWTSKADFEAALHNSYKEVGLEEYVIPGRSLGSVIWESREETPITIPETTAVGISIIDALLSDAIIWFSSFYMMLIGDDDGIQDKALHRSIVALSMKITQDSIVIRDLIVRGYDLQARNLVRSVSEHIDAIYYLCLNPTACAEFIKTEDEESSNRFWYDHLRKAHASNDAKIDEIVGRSQLAKFSDFRRTEGRTFSAAHHPSYWACATSQLIPNSTDNILFNIFGVPSEMSFRTGKFLFYNLAECAVLMPIICRPIADYVVRSSDDHPFKLFVRLGIPHLITMIFALIENWKAPVFQFSKEFEEILSALPKSEESGEFE